MKYPLESNFITLKIFMWPFLRYYTFDGSKQKSKKMTSAPARLITCRQKIRPWNPWCPRAIKQSAMAGNGFAMHQWLTVRRQTSKGPVITTNITAGFCWRMAGRLPGWLSDWLLHPQIVTISTKTTTTTVVVLSNRFSCCLQTTFTHARDHLAFGQLSRQVISILVGLGW